MPTQPTNCQPDLAGFVEVADFAVPLVQKMRLQYEAARQRRLKALRALHQRQNELTRTGKEGTP